MPSSIKIGNQRLADFENGKSLFDELREVLGLRGLCLTRADLAWDVSWHDCCNIQADLSTATLAVSLTPHLGSLSPLNANG